MFSARVTEEDPYHPLQLNIRNEKQNNFSIKSICSSCSMLIDKRSDNWREKLLPFFEKLQVKIDSIWFHSNSIQVYNNSLDLEMFGLQYCSS